jgi:hypothetical protein
MEYFPSMFLWLFPDVTKGGCIAALDCSTYLFGMFDERKRGAFCSRVYSDDLNPKPGDLVQFAIEFASDGSFGRSDYRITSLLSLPNRHPEDRNKLQDIFDDFPSWEQEANRATQNQKFIGGPKLRELGLWALGTAHKKRRSTFGLTRHTKSCMLSCERRTQTKRSTVVGRRFSRGLEDVSGCSS